MCVIHNPVIIVDNPAPRQHLLVLWSAQRYFCACN